MGLYQRLLRTVSPNALLGASNGETGAPGGTSRSKQSYASTTDRLLRTPLLFETMEPRVLLSGDPLTAATQTALLAAKGTGFVAPHPAQRWARQALFFLVWSCPQPVLSATLCELVNVASPPG